MKNSTRTLLKKYAEIMNELYERKVIRTFNNPVADYAEWLTTQKLDLELEINSKAGFDAINKKGVKFQVKCRRLNSSKSSRQLGVIRKLEEKEFDYLIGILFDENFSVKEAYKIPHHVIDKYAKYSPHQNGHILYLRGDILKDKSVKDISNKLK